MTTLEVIFFAIFFLWLLNLSSKSRRDNTIGSAVSDLDERVKELEGKWDEFVGNGD